MMDPISCEKNTDLRITPNPKLGFILGCLFACILLGTRTAGCICEFIKCRLLRCVDALSQLGGSGDIALPLPWCGKLFPKSIYSKGIAESQVNKE